MALSDRLDGVDDARGSTAGKVQRLAPVELVKFTAVVALLAILADAAVGHALAWENDPYWTYWITKTFLIATVFALGTAWLGVGAGRGAVIYRRAWRGVDCLLLVAIAGWVAQSLGVA
jgi:hypothetical protein